MRTPPPAPPPRQLGCVPPTACGPRPEQAANTAAEIARTTYRRITENLTRRSLETSGPSVGRVKQTVTRGREYAGNLARRGSVSTDCRGDIAPDNRPSQRSTLDTAELFQCPR